MRKQQHFKATLESIYNGDDDIFDDLQVAMESYSEAEHWLAALESGDATPVPTILARHEIPGVSLESVQVHVNSAQVQAVVDFLKKWIPIVLKKIRELVKKFWMWFQARLTDLSGKIHSLQTRLKHMVMSQITIRPSDDLLGKAAFALTGPGITYIADAIHVQRMVSWTDLLGTMASTYRSGNSLSCPPWDQFRFAASVWLTMSDDNELFPRLHERETPEVLLKAVTALPSPTTASQRLQEVVAKSKDSEPFKITREAALALLAEWDNLQFKLAALARPVEQSISQIHRRLETFERGDYGNLQDRDANQMTLQKLTVKSADYCLAAVTAGLQQRYRIVGKGVALLNAAIAD